MILPSNLISDFVKATKDKPAQPRESVLYGTIQSDVEYVKLDGSTVLTPIENKAVIAKTGDRVTVTIKDHKAIVTGNIASPAAREKDTLKIVDLNAINIEISNIKADITLLKNSNVTIENTLESHTESINTLTSENETINETLTDILTQIQDLKNRVTILEESALNNPIVASTEAEMAALLIAKNEGKIVKYIGPTGIYKQNTLYTIVDET